MIITALLLGHVLLALVLVSLILLQHGKGADAGAAFGSGASSTVFGSQGSASFMSRATKWLAVLFFVTSGSLAYLGSERQAPVTSVMDEEPAIEQRDEPRDDLDSDLPPVEAPDEERQQPPARDEETGEEDAPPPDSAS